jgi:hypothetical protein
MNRIEDELKAVLRRKPAPPGFDSRVMERIDEDTHVRAESRGFTPNRFRILAVAATVSIIVWACVYSFQQHVHTRNEAALQRTLNAISIAALQLDRAERKAFDPIPWERLSRQLVEFENYNKK